MKKISTEWSMQFPIKPISVYNDGTTIGEKKKKNGNQQELQQMGTCVQNGSIKSSSVLNMTKDEEKPLIAS